MIIQSEKSSLSIRIDGYQYPHHKCSNTDYDYDANWLDVEIQYSDNTGTHQYLNACFLTYELESLVEQLSDVISGKELLYISDFMEPYLKIAIMRVGDTIMLGIGYVYNTTDGIWKEHRVAERISLDKANQILKKLKCMSEKYPGR